MNNGARHEQIVIFVMQITASEPFRVTKSLMKNFGKMTSRNRGFTKTAATKKLKISAK